MKDDNDNGIVSINEKSYYDVKTFAYLTNKTTQTIYRLIDKGNALRKLRAIKPFGKPLIPIEELSEFPFTAPGPRGSETVTYFGEQGEA